MAVLNCPHCNTELAPGKVDDLELDVCLSCHGAWFEPDELRKAKDMELPDGDWLDFEIWKHKDQFKINAGKVNCPRCEKRLCRLLYGDTHVEIDVCPDCQGIWLDEAELGAIIKALDAEINQKTFGEYINAALQEGAELINGPEPLHSEWKDFKHIIHLMHQRFFIEHPKLRDAMAQVQGTFPFLQ